MTPPDSDKSGAVDAPSLAAPITYFTQATWPDGDPTPGTPRAVLYAAEFASFLRRRALEHGGTLNYGFEQIQKRTGLSGGSLRHISDGRRWPGLQIVAHIEEAFREDSTGYSAVLRRQDRDEADGQRSKR